MSDFLLPKESKTQYSLKVTVEQVTRSGTSIGANIAEGKGASSTADMISKYSIALKEAYETRYWLNLLISQNFIDENQYGSLDAELHEIINMLVAALRTLRKK